MTDAFPSQMLTGLMTQRFFISHFQHHSIYKAKDISPSMVTPLADTSSYVKLSLCRDV